MPMAQYPLLIGASRTGYWQFPGTRHVGLYAQTDSGKTQGFTLPNCLAWPGSLIVLDIKGSCYQRTAGHRRYVRGQDVYVFNPTAYDGCSHRWNPLDVIDRTSDRRFDQITRQAHMLLPENPGGSSNADRYWEPRARDAIASVMALLAETPGEPLTYSRLFRVFLAGVDAAREWLAKQVADRRAAGNPYSEQVILGLADFLSGAPELIDAVRTTVTANLWSFWNPVMQAATDVSDFGLQNIRRRPMTVYITVAPADIPRTRFLLRLLFDQALNLNTDLTPSQDPTLTVPVLLLFDEFAQLGPMPNQAHAAQYCREYGIRVAYVVQDKAQLISLYGPATSRDIFSNMGLEIVFGTNDLEQARELEQRMGDATVPYETTNRPKFLAGFRPGQQTVAQHFAPRPVMYDQEVLQMPKRLQLVLQPNEMPWRCNRILGYSDPTFARHVYPPPLVPSLPVTVRYDDGSIKIPNYSRRPAPPAVAVGQGKMSFNKPPRP